VKIVFGETSRESAGIHEYITDGSGVVATENGLQSEDRL
jgi:hypothetical protein